MEFKVPNIPTFSDTMIFVYDRFVPFNPVDLDQSKLD